MTDNNQQPEATEEGQISGKTIVVWFSCGAASAVAAKLTLEKYGGANTIRIVNNPIQEEGEDNRRFLRDVENWLGVAIEIAFNRNFPNHSAVEVWEKRRYMAGIQGAPCTLELKKEARRQWEETNHPDWHVLGFTADAKEQKRFTRFRMMERPNTLPVLIEAGITKKKCFEIINKVGIILPVAYRNGFKNANCEGCPKATSATYWNQTREKSPDVFAARAAQSRALGARLARYKGKRIFLDELPPEAKGGGHSEVDCGIFCDINKTL